MSALKVEDDSSHRIIPSNKGIFVVGAFGHAQPQTIAKVRCWLLGKEKATETLNSFGTQPYQFTRTGPPEGKVVD